VSYNIIDDTNGTLYTSNINNPAWPPPANPPTDKNDITIITSNTFTPNGTLTYTNPSPNYNDTVLNPTSNPSRIQHSQGYKAANVVGNHQSTNPPPGPWTNNPGHVIENRVEIRFASHLSVYSLIVNVNSLNSAGICWEYTLLQLLDANMQPFSPVTGPTWTLGATGQYLAAGAGYSGNAGVGNIVAGDTGTVSGVGSNNTSGGTAGSLDTPGPLGWFFNSNNAAHFNLPMNTKIGGFRFITWLEDVRGSGNAASNFTSSLFSFTISGVIPEPGQVAGMLLLVSGAVAVFLRRLRQRRAT
jgi:hypothetical protein